MSTNHQKLPLFTKNDDPCQTFYTSFYKLQHMLPVFSMVSVFHSFKPAG